ncbi:hypothetical protein GOODEAATRI_026651, partial [Goodea atripinnis]
VWYAASYADFVNQKIHDVTDEERKALQEQEWNWPCYECNRRFVSSEQLQQHLNMHDDKFSSVSRLKYLFIIILVPPPFMTTSTDLCDCLLSDPEAAAEGEAGRGLGQGEDQDAPQNLYAWIHL